MSFGGDGLGEALALCDLMIEVGVEFTPQTEAIAERIRQAHEDDPGVCVCVCVCVCTHACGTYFVQRLVRVCVHVWA
jgi:hypothetical protein